MFLLKWKVVELTNTLDALHFGGDEFKRGRDSFILWIILLITICSLEVVATETANSMSPRS